MSGLKHLGNFLMFVVTVTIVSGLPTFSWAIEISNDWGGHVKVQGSYVDDDARSLTAFLGEDQRWDGYGDFRLTDRLAMGDKVDVEIHYNASYVTGDSYSNIRNLINTFPFIPSGWVQEYAISDRRRLFDLTRTIHEDNHDLLQHRLDRLCVSLKQPFFALKLGRQAVTWGNGLIFNPMDLINPFSPTDTVRDYKTGDDLVFMSVEPESGWNIQMTAVPRRDEVTGDVEKELSSLAVKFHAMAGPWETDVLAARHVDENLLGIGISRNVGEALFRSDVLYSTLNHGSGDDKGCFSLIANLDRSWEAFGKNMYGLLEYHHNGLGHHDMDHALTDPDLLKRIAHGEMYALGRNYLGAMIRVELHPLVQFTLGIIESLDAFTGIAQPRIQLDMTQNSNLQIGYNAYIGTHGTEFGGIEIPGTGLNLSQGNSAYLILGYYF
jgi:hypothetical protein